MTTLSTDLTIKKEKAANAQWAEAQLQEMRGKSKATTELPRNRRRGRRSESLQREDEEAMMAELAAEAQRAVLGRSSLVLPSQAICLLSAACSELSPDCRRFRTSVFCKVNTWRETRQCFIESESAESDGICRAAGQGQVMLNGGLRKSTDR